MHRAFYSLAEIRTALPANRENQKHRVSGYYSRSLTLDVFPLYWYAFFGCERAVIY